MFLPPWLKVESKAPIFRLIGWNSLCREGRVRSATSLSRRALSVVARSQSSRDSRRPGTDSVMLSNRLREPVEAAVSSRDTFGFSLRSSTEPLARRLRSLLSALAAIKTRKKGLRLSSKLLKSSRSPSKVRFSILLIFSSQCLVKKRGSFFSLLELCSTGVSTLRETTALPRKVSRRQCCKSLTA